MTMLVRGMKDSSQESLTMDACKRKQPYMVITFRDCMYTNIKSEVKKTTTTYTAPKLRIFYACIPLTYGPDNNANTDITACHVWSIEDNNLRLFYHHLFPYCL